MDARRRERLASYARGAARRFFVGARRLFTAEPDAEATAAEAEAAAAEELARTAKELRGGMAKMAQLMAYLRGPGAAGDDEARRALGVLWDRAPGVEPAAIRRVVDEDLGGPPETIFATWDDTPMAAASLGQVHAATSREGRSPRPCSDQGCPSISLRALQRRWRCRESASARRRAGIPTRPSRSRGPPSCRR